MIIFLFLIFVFSICAECKQNDSTITLKQWKFQFFEEKNSSDSFNNEISLVSIPHTFNSAEKFNEHRLGIGCYTKDILLAPATGHRIVLYFEGVCLRASIYLDDVLIGVSKYPYLPFEIDLTQFIHKKKNYKLTVQVDNRLRLNDIPDKNCNGWWIYGGLIRDVSILFKPEKQINKLSLSTIYVNRDTFFLNISCSTQIEPDSIRMQIQDEEDSIFYIAQIKPPYKKDITFRIDNVKAWSPDLPYLYNFVFIPYFGNKTGIPITFKRGFAQLTSKSQKLFLNGKQIFLRGIGRHDFYDLNQPLITKEQCLEDLLSLKKLNANFLRIAHFPQHNEIYRICDSLGIIVMDEIPAWKTRTEFLKSETGIKTACGYMHNLIQEHGNFTSVMIWSIGNEFQSYRDDISEYVSKTASYVKRIDSSRLTTYCSYFYHYDKSYDFVDIVSVNEYFGWYLGSLDLLSPMINKLHSQWPDKPIIISEFGAAAQYGYYNSSPKLANSFNSIFNKDLSENHQALYIGSHMREIFSNKNICSGMVVWCFSDFMEPRKKPKLKDFECGINTMGLFNNQRKAKMAAKVVTEVYDSIQKCIK